MTTMVGVKLLSNQCSHLVMSRTPWVETRKENQSILVLGPGGVPRPLCCHSLSLSPAVTTLVFPICYIGTYQLLHT
jgi:hypothetical protein